MDTGLWRPESCVDHPKSIKSSGAKIDSPQRGDRASKSS